MKRVVLCRPQGPRNVGMALRACENFGPCELVLVSPLKKSMLVHPDFVQMSHGAEEARQVVRVVPDLQQALVDCHHVVGFTARVRGKRMRVDWRDQLGELADLAESGDDRVALVFGNEETGMTREEADQCQELLHIRTSPDHTSLNLAMCVTVVLSRLFERPGHRGHEPGGRRLNHDGRQFLKARMKEVFAGKVALNAQAAELIEAAIERVFTRAPLENRDAKAWHLMLRALGSEMRPDDLGLVPHLKGGRRKQFLERALEQDEAQAPQAPDEPSAPGAP